MSDANRTQLGVVEEVVLGTTPVNPVFETLRVTAVNLDVAKTTITSKELRADRKVTDRITTLLESAGDLPQEVSYGAPDTLLRGAMQSEWIFAPVRQNITGATTNISAASATALTVVAPALLASNAGTFAVGLLVRTSGFVAAGNNALRRAGAGSSGTNIALAGGTIDAAPALGARAKVIGLEGAAGDIAATASGLSSTALDFTTLGLAAGMWLWVGGPIVGQQFATAANIGWCRIAAAGGITATALPFDVVPTGWGVDAGAAKTIRAYWGDYIREGTTRRSYSIEQQFQDLVVPTFELAKGMVPIQFELSAPTASIMTCKTTFMGKTGQIPTTARFAGATDLAAPTGDVFNTSSNVGTMLVNGAVIPNGNFVTALTLSIDNSGRRNNGLGSITSLDIRTGTANITAKLSTYYGDPTILTLVRNSTVASYFLPITDPTITTRAYLFDLPRIKFGGGDPTVPGLDTDRMLDTDFQALRHATLGYMLHVQRLEEYNT